MKSARIITVAELVLHRKNRSLQHQAPFLLMPDKPTPPAPETPRHDADQYLSTLVSML